VITKKKSVKKGAMRGGRGPEKKRSKHVFDKESPAREGRRGEMVLLLLKKMWRRACQRMILLEISSTAVKPSLKRGPSKYFLQAGEIGPRANLAFRPTSGRKSWEASVKPLISARRSNKKNPVNRLR